MENETVETVETVEAVEKVEETKEFDINAVLENETFKKYMDSYADKRVSSAITKKDTEYKEKLAEADRKSKMTAEELQTTRETELAEREERIKKLELNASKTDLFKNKGYSLDLTDFVGGNTLEEIGVNAEKINTVIAALVEKQVTERLKTNSYTPPKGGSGTTGVTKEDFSKLGYKERVKLSLENPTLYKELSK